MNADLLLSLGQAVPSSSSDIVANVYAEKISRVIRLQTLLESHSLSNNEGYPVISLSLPDGTQWSKSIWTRTAIPSTLYRWNTPEEVLSYLISFDYHKDWATVDVPARPPSGTIKFYNRTETKNFRDDGYDWKTRVPAKKTVREDRMKLKVLGQQLICATYAHSESNPLFHRRCYWFTQHPDMVIVHYLETDANSHKKTVLKKSQENGFEVTMEGTSPADLALLAISDDNVCKYLANGHDGENPQSLLSTLSRHVWQSAFQTTENCPGNLITSLNKKLLANITRDTQTSAPPTTTSSVPLILVNQAMELLKLQAYSSQFGGFGLLPKGTGCLSPSVLLQAATLIMSNLPSTVARPHGVQLNPAPTPLQVQSFDATQLVKPPMLNNSGTLISDKPDVTKSFDVNSFTTATTVAQPAAAVASPVVSQHSDFNLEDFARFAQNLRTMNPLKDIQHLSAISESSPSSPVPRPLSIPLPIPCHPSSPPPPTTEHCHVKTDIPSQQQPLCNGITHVPSSEPHNNIASLEISALEQQAMSLLSSGQMSDLMNMTDFGLSVNDIHLSNDFTDGSTDAAMECNTNTDNYLDELFNLSDTPSAPFNPDNLLHSIPMTMSSSQNNTTVDRRESDESHDSIPDTSKQLDIDNETLNQLLINSVATGDEMDTMPAPLSPVSQYIDSLVPSDDPLTDDPPLLHTMDEHTHQPCSSLDYPINETSCLSLPVDTESTSASVNGFVSDFTIYPNTSSDLCISPTSSHVVSSDVCKTVSTTTHCMESSTILSTTLSSPTGSLHLSSTDNTDISNQPTSLPTNYRVNSPLPSPSSPSIASVSSLSTAGGESYFDATDPPSVAELCEMLGESRMVQNSDFSHLSLSDSEQQELIKASLVIQNTMRKYKNHNFHGREKDAVLCIERNYRRYRELKRSRDAAARRIQLQYRMYRKRAAELNRATLFIQQMYRYQRHKHRSKKHQ